jgi:hypothetical protein
MANGIGGRKIGGWMAGAMAFVHTDPSDIRTYQD